MTEGQATVAHTALYLEYHVLWDAACQAAIDAGAAKPRGASERAMAGVLVHQGRGYFWQTELAQSRIHEAAPEQARIGAPPPKCGARRETPTRALCWPPTAGTGPA